MDFQISEDRRLLSETLRRYFQDAGDISAQLAAAYEAPWHDPEVWTALSNLGVFYAFASEEAGGLGGQGFDIATVFQELGRALTREPVLGQMMAIKLLEAAGADLESTLSGEKTYAVAIGEIDAPYDLEDITTTAVDGRLNGRKTVVLGGGAADTILVAARDDGAISLWAVEKSDADIAAYGMIDGGPAAEVILDNCPGTCLLYEAETALTDGMEWGALALSAEALGAMEAAFEMLREYLTTREQFGRPIGQFQTLQHRAVDLSIEIEQARSSVMLAANAMGTPAQSKRVSQAKLLVGQIARKVSEEVIQMHGGIGMTWDYPVSHFAKRLIMIDHQMGDTDWHLERLVAQL